MGNGLQTSKSSQHVTEQPGQHSWPTNTSENWEYTGTPRDALAPYPWSCSVRTLVFWPRADETRDQRRPVGRVSLERRYLVCTFYAT